MTDWIGLLDEAIETGDAMRCQVPGMLADPEITVEQVKSLFAALEQHAQFSEKLKAALEGLGYDFAVVDKAGDLEELYVDLAASAAETLKLMRGRNPEASPGEGAGAEVLHSSVAAGLPAGKQNPPTGR